MKKALLISLILGAAGCAAEAATPSSEADVRSVPTAIICSPDGFPSVDGNHIQFLESSGEWVATTRVGDQKVRMQIGDYDGLERPYVRLVANGQPVDVALDYRETVTENGNAIDPYEKRWKPEVAYSNLDDGVEFRLAINGRETAFLCGRELVDIVR